MAINEGGVLTGGNADWANLGDPNGRGEVRMGENVTRVGVGGEAKWTLGNDERGAVMVGLRALSIVSKSTEARWRSDDLAAGPRSNGSISVSSVSVSVTVTVSVSIRLI